jgi:hypothetical protein
MAVFSIKKWKEVKVSSMKKSLMVVIALAAIVVISGCAPMVYVNPRQLTVDEIITMSAQGVGKDVIIQHISSTHSRFKLTADDIVKLTQEKVDPDVIKAMIKSENAYPDEGNYTYRSWGYPYLNNPYYYYYYWYDYPGYYNYYRPYYQYNYRGGYDNHGYDGNRGDSGGNRNRSGGESRGGGTQRR